MTTMTWEKQEASVVEIKVSFRDIVNNTLISLGNVYFNDLSTGEHGPRLDIGTAFKPAGFLKTKNKNKKLASHMIRKFFKEGYAAMAVGDVMDEIEDMFGNDIQFQLCIANVPIENDQTVDVIVPCSDILI